MGLSKDAIKYLEKQAQKKASELAHEAQERLVNGYISLIDLYYADYDPTICANTQFVQIME